MGQIAFMPIMVLAARICPLGVEATLFALLMSIFNLGSFVSQEFGALIMNWLGITETNFNFLWLLVLISNFGTFIPFLFINWLPEEHIAPEMPKLLAVTASSQSTMSDLISESDVQETNSDT
jgi:hypothetical protein